MTIRRTVPGTVSQVIKFVGGLGERQVETVVSTEASDRMDDIIIQKGIDFSAFMKLGGPVLWQHDYNYPVARTIRMGLVNGNLTAVAQFPPIGTSERSDECYRLIKAGVVTSASLGFIPKKWEFRDLESGYGIRFDKVECIEYSFVSVPAQAEAMIIGKSWRGPALTARSSPVLSTLSFAGTARQRRFDLARHLKRGI
jgi:HK97 family phage prohead protease